MNLIIETGQNITEVANQSAKAECRCKCNCYSHPSKERLFNVIIRVNVQPSETRILTGNNNPRLRYLLAALSAPRLTKAAVIQSP